MVFRGSVIKIFRELLNSEEVLVERVQNVVVLKA